MSRFILVTGMNSWYSVDLPGSHQRGGGGAGSVRLSCNNSNQCPSLCISRLKILRREGPTDGVYSFPSLFEKTFSLMFIGNNLTKPCQCNYRFRTLDICSRRSVLCSCGMFRCLLSYDWWRAYSYRCWFTTLILWYVLDSQIVCISEAHFKLLSL